MIQSTFMHAKKLAGEKKAEDEELAKIKETYRIKTEQFLMSSEYLFFFNLNEGQGWLVTHGSPQVN